MDLTVLNLAVPSLSADLAPSSAQLLWIVDIYGFLVAGSLITMGTLGDRIGRRKLLLIGAAAFGLASIVAAFSTSAEMLIATRALLGLAGATLAPSTLSLIRNMFLDAEERTFAVGIWISSYSAGAAIGPLVGGVLLEHFWWGSAFLIGVPVMVLLLIVGPFLLPEFRDPHAGRLDVTSAALSLASALAVIYGLKHIAQDGVAAAPVLSIVGGLVLGTLFVHRQRTLPNPLIDLRLFAIPAFSTSLSAYTLATFVAFGAFVFVAQYLQLVLGLSPLRAGLWTAPFAAAFIIGSMVTPRLARRVRPAYVISGGFVLAAVGFALLMGVAEQPGLPVLVIGFVVYSLGLAPVFTLATDLIVGSAPPEKAGAAAAISEAGSEFGGALGIAILGSIGTAVYRTAMIKNAPATIPLDMVEAARDTLGGALAVATRLPEPLGGELLTTARAAFTQALETTALISVVVVLMTAIATVVALRDRNGRQSV
jgi:DHA2 family multidrug resistance protein-like MFS transporter